MNKPTDTAGVIAPPPLLFLGALALGVGIDAVLGRTATATPPWLREALAIAALAMAGGLIWGAFSRFSRAGTRPEPWKPATAIVTTGVYRFTRNPMYLGMALITLAVALLLDSVACVLLMVPLIALVQWGVISREERYMEAKFGDDYRRYRNGVRRWL